jgi:hypothetical protein
MWGPIYALSEQKLPVLVMYLEERVDSDKICPSKSPTGVSICCVPKAHGRGLHLSVEYRGCNHMTIMNWYPLVLMKEHGDRVVWLLICTKINLNAWYILIEIKSGDELKLYSVWDMDIMNTRSCPSDWQTRKLYFNILWMISCKIYLNIVLWSTSIIFLFIRTMIKSMSNCLELFLVDYRIMTSLENWISAHSIRNRLMFLDIL